MGIPVTFHQRQPLSNPEALLHSAYYLTYLYSSLLVFCFFFLAAAYRIYTPDFTRLSASFISLPLSSSQYTSHFICAGISQKPGSRNTHKPRKLLNKSFQYALCLGEAIAALLNRSYRDGEKPRSSGFSQGHCLVFFWRKNKRQKNVSMQLAVPKHHEK